MAQGLFGTNIAMPQIAQVALRPQGLAGTSAVRPQEVQTGGNLRALSEALGGLNSSLADYFTVKDQLADDPNSQINKEWIAKAQQMDTEQLRALAASGEASGHQVRQDALDSLLGERAGADFIPMAEKHFATEFDRTSGDVGAEYDRLRKEFADALPNEVARGNFYQLTEQHRARTIGGITEERIVNTKTQIGDTIVAGWYTRITEAQKDGTLDPAEVSAAVFDASDANGAYFQLTKPEQDATIWSLAQRLAADGNPEAAEALLDTPRQGSAAISELPEYAVKSRQLIEAAKTEKARRASEGSAKTQLDLRAKADAGTLTLEEMQQHIDSGLYTEDQGVALVDHSNAVRAQEVARAARVGAANRAEDEVIAQATVLFGQQGGVNRIKDVTIPSASGGERTLTRNEIIEAVRTRQERAWQEQEESLVNERGMAPEVAKEAMRDVRQGWYIDQFIPNPQWQREFAALPGIATPAALDKNPGLIAKSYQTAEDYLALRAKSPTYAASLVTPAAKDFLESYAALRELSGRSPDEAIVAAAAYANLPAIDKAKVAVPYKVRADLIDDALDEQSGAKALGPSNRLLSDQIDRLAALGVPPEEIGGQLKKWVVDNTIVVNGVLVPVQGGMGPDFPNIVKYHLEQAFEARGRARGLESADDLSIMPVNGKTRWSVIDKRTGIPLGSYDLTPDVIANLRARMEADREQRIKDDLTEATEAAKRPKYTQVPSGP